MKTEDIDKRIGMPDVDAEWAKFESEVIGKKATSPKTVWLWSLSIAASIALVAGIFLLNRHSEEPKQLQAKLEEPAKTKEMKEQPTAKEEQPAEQEIESVVEPHKQRPSSDLLAEAASPRTEETDYACGEIDPQYPGGDRALIEFIKTHQHYPELAMECGARGRVMMTFLVDSAGYVSDIKPIKYLLKYDTQYMNSMPADQQVALKEKIKTLMGEESTRILSLMPQKWTPGSLFGKARSVRYNVPITFNVTDAERQTYLAQRSDALQGRIAGLDITGDSDSARQARRDSLLRQREINMDSMLIVVNGTPIPLYRFKPNGVAPYLYKQHQLLSDSDLDVEERISRGVYQPYGASEEERKRRCFETYGERAKYGVIEVTAVPDTYCDDYISKHPELKKERQHIEGYVNDEDNKPLADAWVYIRGKGIGAATDSKGYFSIWIPQNQKELWISRPGYVRVQKTLPSDDSKLIIHMRNATTIKDVIIRKREQNDNEAKPIPLREIDTKDFDVQELDKK